MLFSTETYLADLSLPKVPLGAYFVLNGGEEQHIATLVEYWGVGASIRGVTPLTTGEISSHLLADWIPSLPVTFGPSFIGWPPFLLEALNVKGEDLIVFRAEATRSERQWKSFLSWMLGVAGTRHVLASEGYRWVAPVSAFYTDAVQVVDLSAWHPLFPRSILTTSRPTGSPSRLCPDYLAVRPIPSTKPSQGFEWAVAEAKGTRLCLTNMQTCPVAWSNQARNIVVKAAGSTLAIPRHLVVATRVNLSAANQLTRRIQIRAWNRADETEEMRLPPELAVEIATAHLFGLFRGLGLRENARTIAVSVQARTEIREDRLQHSTRGNAERLSKLADDELQRYSRKSDAKTKIRIAAEVPIETELGTIYVELAEPLIMLAHRVRKAENQHAAAAALMEVDSQLDDWQFSRRAVSREAGRMVLPFGVELRLPRGF